MARAEPPLRDQLLQAQAALRRQIEILRAGPASVGRGGAFIDSSGMIAELGRELAQIEDCLSGEQG